MGSWFHMSCIGVTDMPGPCEDWWCSKDCKESGISIFCRCNRVRHGPTILCSLREDCEEGMVFHVDCVNASTVHGRLTINIRHGVW